jgi:hypothetical protein
MNLRKMNNSRSVEEILKEIRKADSEERRDAARSSEAGSCRSLARADNGRPKKNDGTLTS